MRAGISVTPPRSGLFPIMTYGKTLPAEGPPCAAKAPANVGTVSRPGMFPPAAWGVPPVLWRVPAVVVFPPAALLFFKKTAREVAAFGGNTRITPGADSFAAAEANASGDAFV